MENIYIISDYSAWINQLVNDLKIEDDNVIGYQEHIEDWQTDSWIIDSIPKSIDCILIPVELGENMYNSVHGLKIGMHIRLMQSSIKYIPIIFISNREEWQIRQLLRDNLDKNHLDYIFGTKAVDLLKPNVDEIKAVIENIQPLSEEDYLPHFYNHIHITALEEDGGKHSISNIWGALRLNEVLNLNAIKNKDLTRRTKELYFKYLNALHNDNTQAYEDLSPLQCEGKRILLIDDEADKGWEEVLKVIFKGSDFHTINFESKLFNESYDETLRFVKNEEWGLILLDLRLDPKSEDLPNQVLKTEEYSGAKLLKEIKDNNEGTQVIMLTASNKAWNMKKLLELGADGYYIKESPEFNFSTSLTNENYENLKKEVERCFEKKFLKELYIINQKIDSRLQLENDNLGNRNLSRKTVNLIKNVTLPQAFNAAIKISKEKPEYALYSFLEYYKISEALSEDLIQDHSNSNRRSIKILQKGKGKSNEIEFISDLPLISKITPIKDESGKYIETYRKENYTPTEKEQSFYTGRLSASLQFSALLLLKFKLDTETVTDFMYLNNLRNKTVVHFSKDSVDNIMVEDIIKFASILEKAITNL